MIIIGAILILIGALYHQIWWMTAVFAAGLIVLALGIERSIIAKLDAVQEKLREKAVRGVIKEHQEEQSKREPDGIGVANNKSEDIAASRGESST